MKRFWLLPGLVFLLVSMQLQAQQIAVESFRRLDNDMDARITHARKDQNGDVCALIKIVTTQTGFTFEGGSLGIVHSEQKVAEIWVWVPHKAQRITIKHPVLGVLRDYAYPLTIEKATAYEMKLTTGRIETFVHPPSLDAQWLLIMAEPAEAMIYLNNIFEGTAILQKKCLPGIYEYRVEAPLHHTEAGKLTLTAGEKLELTVRLKPRYGFLQVSTSPEQGARILIDGKETGLLTPALSGRLESGEHTVTVVKELFQPVSRRMIITDSLTVSLELDMPVNYAGVEVDLPAEASLSINGTVAGKGKWAGRLPSGVYAFEAGQPKHMPAMQELNLEPGMDYRIELKPVPITGTLDVVTHPPKASLLLNGQPVGESPASLKNLLIGDYSLTIDRPGFATIQRNITIREGETAIVDETLQQASLVGISTEPPGATIEVNGVYAGTTPLRIPLEYGSHRLLITRGSQTLTENIRVVPGGPESFHFEIREVQRIKIISKPDNAKLFINGVYAGLTPYKAELNAGIHYLRIEKDGLQATKTIEITPDGKETTVELKISGYQKMNNPGRDNSKDAQPDRAAKTRLGGEYSRTNLYGPHTGYGASIEIWAKDAPVIFGLRAQWYQYDTLLLIPGTGFNYTSSVTQLPLAFYINVMLTESRLRPYLGLGFGTRLRFDDGGLSDQKLPAIFSGNFGFIIILSSAFDLSLNGSWNGAIIYNEYQQPRIRDSYMTLGVGLGIRF